MFHLIKPGVLGLVLYVMSITTAHAVAVYTFDFRMTSGLETGKVGTATFSFNDDLFGGVGTETARPFGASDSQGEMLTFDIDFLGITWEWDPSFLPQWPFAQFDGGVLDWVSYHGISAGTLGAHYLDICWSPTSSCVSYNPPGPQSSDGVADDPTHVPEPSTFALLTLGLVGIGYKRHRSKKSA